MASKELESLPDLEKQSKESRYLYLMVGGTAVMALGSISWGAALFEQQRLMEAWHLGSVVATAVGAGAMAVGSVMHHRLAEERPTSE